MAQEQFTILAPCGMLGYGFPKSSFIKGMECSPDAIVVDAGSTDAGPHKLGAGTAIVSRQACKKDLEQIITAGVKARIPIIIGSAGGSGAKVHVEWTQSIIMEILQEHKLHDLKIAIIWADIAHKVVEAKLEQGIYEPLGLAVKPLTKDRLEATNSIVAQMGHEPILKALEAEADIIICGRAYDPSPFAAVAMHHGFDTALAYHLGKILECAALSADPGTTKDCMLGILKRDSFIVKPLNDKRKCTAVSVAAHTFYEKDQVSLYLNDFGYKKLAGAKYDWQFNQDYEFKVTAQGDTITFSVNGEQVLQHKDDTYGYGMFGVSTIAAARTYYRNIRVTEL